MTSSTVYILGLAKSFSSYTLHITSFSTDTGEAIYSGHIPSSITTGLSEAFILKDLKRPETAPQVVWFEQGKIKSLELTPELKAKPAAVKGAVYKKIKDVGLSEHGQFVAIAEDGSGRVIKLTPEGLKVIWEYTDSVRHFLTAGCRSPRVHRVLLVHVSLPHRLHLLWGPRCRWEPLHCARVLDPYAEGEFSAAFRGRRY